MFCDTSTELTNLIQNVENQFAKLTICSRKFSNKYLFLVPPRKNEIFLVLFLHLSGSERMLLQNYSQILFKVELTCGRNIQVLKQF